MHNEVTPQSELYEVMAKNFDVVAVENMLGELEAKGLEVGSIVNELDLSKMEWFSSVLTSGRRPDEGIKCCLFLVKVVCFRSALIYAIVTFLSSLFFFHSSSFNVIYLT